MTPSLPLRVHQHPLTTVRGSTTTPRRFRSGFTFIEVLATLLLLGIVLPAVMSGISLCLTTASVARHQSEAAGLCHSKLTELATQSDLQHVNLGGDFGTDWPDYRWNAVVTDGDITNLKVVEVSVTWRHLGRERHVTMTTQVYSNTSTTTGGTT